MKMWLSIFEAMSLACLINFGIIIKVLKSVFRRSSYCCCTFSCPMKITLPQCFVFKVRKYKSVWKTIQYTVHFVAIIMFFLFVKLRCDNLLIIPIPESESTLRYCLIIIGRKKCIRKSTWFSHLLRTKI